MPLFWFRGVRGEHAVELVQYTSPELRKWLPMFGGAVNSVFLLVSAELVERDGDWPHFGDSCDFVEQVVRSYSLLYVPVVMLLTNFELFKAKVEPGLLSKHHPGFAGGTNAAAGAEFMCAGVHGAESGGGPSNARGVHSRRKRQRSASAAAGSRCRGSSVAHTMAY